MESFDCQKHHFKNDYAFCLEPGCHHSLVCEMCLVLDKQHIDHKFVIVKRLIKNEEYEVKRIFGENYIKSMKDNQTAEQFIQQFDNQFNKFLDEREEELRTPFEKMVANYRQMLEKLKQNIYDKYRLTDMKSIEQIRSDLKNLVETDNSQPKQKAIKDQINGCSILDDIQKMLDSAMEQFQQVNQQSVTQLEKLFEELEIKQNIVSKQYDGHLEYVKYLKQCKCEVSISSPNQINDFRNKIQQFQQEGKDYRIYLSFTSSTNIQFKQQVIDMIDELEVNHKVGRLYFYFCNGNEINAQLLIRIANNYHNLYDIYTCDYYDQLDNQIHDQFKLILKQSTVLNFTIYFYSGQLSKNDQGLQALKQYNKIIQDKPYLEYLYYYHSRITKSGSNKQQIEQLINELDNMSLIY